MAYEKGENMRAINGFAVLCAMGLLARDAMADSSIAVVAFDFAILIVNLVFYMTDER